MSEDKFEQAKKELKKLIGKSKLSKNDKKELGAKINEATTPEMVTEIMKDVVLDCKKGLGEKIKDAVKGKPGKEPEGDTTMVRNGVRIGVNDIPEIEVEPKNEKPKPKPRPIVRAERCPLCQNSVVDGECLNKKCKFDPTKPIVPQISRPTTSTVHKSPYPVKR